MCRVYITHCISVVFSTKIIIIITVRYYCCSSSARCSVVSYTNLYGIADLRMRLFFHTFKFIFNTSDVFTCHFTSYKNNTLTHSHKYWLGLVDIWVQPNQTKPSQSTKQKTIATNKLKRISRYFLFGANNGMHDGMY